MKTVEDAAKDYAASKSSSEVFQEQHAKDFKSGVEFAQRWISVKEELPEDSDISESVNTKTKDGYIFIHRRLFVDGKYVWSNGNDADIAFWRPIELK